MSSKRPSVDQVLLKARTLARKGELEHAAQLYRAILEKHPQNRRASESLKSIEQSPLVERRTVLGKEPTQEQIDALTSLYSQGRLQDALEEGTRLAERFPDTPSIFNIVGIVNAALGRYQEAIAALTNALRLRPDSAEAHSNLGAALNGLGRYEEAIASLTDALRLKPDYPEAHGNLGAALNGLSRYEEAIASLTNALRLRPDSAEVHSNLGAAFNGLGRHEEAIASFTAALRLRPDLAEAHNNLGNCFNALSRYEEAIASYTAALRLRPHDTEAHSNLGSALNNLGKHEEAIVSLNNVLRLRPDFAEAHNNLGTAFHDLGRHEEAIASYTMAIQLKPRFAEAFRNLGNVKRCKPGDPRFAQMLELMAHPGLSQRDATHLGFALGKAYEDIGDAHTAFRHLSEGNRLRKLDLCYEIGQDRRLFALIRSMFSVDDLPAPANTHPATKLVKRPIFIVGMPRSGTTLVEQILASHSQIYGAGELEALNSILDPILNDIQRVQPVQLTATTLEGIREGYLTKLHSVDAAAPYVTDKMPDNFRWIGFILTAMPEAKVVHVQRDPIATCWSVFKHYFSSSGNGYAYDLADVAEYYKLYLDLMAFWQQKFPDRIYELNYEALTEHQRDETRKLLEYCGLDWEDRCLEFYETERAVKTASSSQVRQKMYQGSSEAWRKYEAYIQPMIEALGR